MGAEGVDGGASPAGDEDLEERRVCGEKGFGCVMRGKCASCVD